MGMQERSSKDKEKLESDSMKNTKNWQTYRISMAWTYFSFLIDFHYASYEYYQYIFNFS